MYNKYFTMKKSQLKEAIKAEIKSVLSENRYDINDPNSPLGRLNDEYESSGLKGIVDNYGLDVVLMMLSSGEYGDRLNESVLTEDFNDDNRGLAYIKSDGERDGFESFTQYAGKQDLKNIPDLEAYTDGFAKGVMQKGNKLVQLISRATVGGADAEPLMKMIGLNRKSKRIREIAPMGPGQTTTLADFEDEEDKLVRVSQKEVRNQLNQYENGKIDGDDLANGIEQIVFGDITPRGMMREEDEMSDTEKNKAAEKDAEKEKVGKQASKLSQADEDRYERIKNGLEKLKKKGDEESIKRMKAILGKKDVQKLIKAKGRKEDSFM